MASTQYKKHKGLNIPEGCRVQQQLNIGRLERFRRSFRVRGTRDINGNTTQRRHEYKTTWKYRLLDRKGMET